MTREFVKHIEESLRNDDHWKVDSYRATNEKLGVAVWIANGFFFLHFEFRKPARGDYTAEVQIYLSLREKFVIWRALRGLKKTARARHETIVLETIITRRLDQ